MNNLIFVFLPFLGMNYFYNWVKDNMNDSFVEMVSTGYHLFNCIYVIIMIYLSCGTNLLYLL